MHTINDTTTAKTVMILMERNNMEVKYLVKQNSQSVREQDKKVCPCPFMIKKANGA